MCSALHPCRRSLREALLVAAEGLLFPVPLPGPVGENERLQRQTENYVSGRFSPLHRHHHCRALCVRSLYWHDLKIPSLHGVGVQTDQVPDAYHEVARAVLLHENAAYCHDQLHMFPLFTF